MQKGLLTLLVGLSLIASVGCGKSKSATPQESTPSTTPDSTIPEEDTDTTCTKDCVTMPPAGTFITYQGDLVMKDGKNRPVPEDRWTTFLEEQMICKKGAKWPQTDCDDIAGRRFVFNINGSFASSVLIVNGGAQVQFMPQGELFLIQNSTGYEIRGPGRFGTFAYNAYFQALIRKQPIPSRDVKMWIKYRNQVLGYINAHSPYYQTQ